MGSFATDFKNRISGFDARAGMKYSEFAYSSPRQGDDLGIAASDLQAAAFQITQLIRFRDDERFTPAPDWLSCPNYGWVFYSDYVADMFPGSIWVCPQDKQRQELRYPPDGPRVQPGHKGEGSRIPQVPQAADPAMQRWGYSSSYQLVPAAWSRDQLTDGLAAVSQGASNSDYLVPKHDSFGPSRTLSEVRFPSSKVLVMDTIDRHHSDGTLFYADPQAEQPLLFGDLSVRSVRTRDTDVGFQPNDPTSGRPTRLRYAPSGYELNWTPASRDIAREYEGHYRWTRGGLQGRDMLPGLIDTTSSASSSMPIGKSLFESATH